MGSDWGVKSWIRLFLRFYFETSLRMKLLLFVQPFFGFHVSPLRALAISVSLAKMRGVFRLQFNGSFVPL